MPHNSMFILGLATNEKWLHAVRQDKRPDSTKSEEELAYNGERISLTFRHIGTFLNKDATRIWGQGAISKTKETAGRVISGGTAEAEKMIIAFGTENQSSTFDWPAEYGPGFDVLHIAEGRPQLFLSVDPIANLRVQLCLAEKGIAWMPGPPPPEWQRVAGNSGFPGFAPENAFIKFVDNDPDHTVVEGDIAIMLYLEMVYGNPHLPPPSNRNQYALGLTRVHQAENLRSLFGDIIQIKLVRQQLRMFEGFLDQSKFIAGDMFSLADITFWPVLREARRQSRECGKERYPKLSEYYDKVMQRVNVKKVVDEAEEE
jgi:hypothetical protein